MEMESRESKLFNTVLSNPHHVLYELLAPEKDIGYNLWQQSHSLTLPLEDSNLIRIFTRCLYTCYCILPHHFIVFAVNFISCVIPLLCMLMLWFTVVRLIKETTYLLTYSTTYQRTVNVPDIILLYNSRLVSAFKCPLKYLRKLGVMYTLCVRAGCHTLWVKGTTGLHACWDCEGHSLGRDTCGLTSVGHSGSTVCTCQMSANIAKKVVTQQRHTANTTFTDLGIHWPDHRYESHVIQMTRSCQLDAETDNWPTCDHTTSTDTY